MRSPEEPQRPAGEAGMHHEDESVEPMTSTGQHQPLSSQMPMGTESRRSMMSMPGADEYLRRFEVVQAEFIDEPKKAVQKAESLVSEAIDRMMNSLREELHRSREHMGEGDETEQLRLAMKRYREMLYSFSERGV